MVFYSILFYVISSVPGSDTRKLNKIPSIKADCICLDCEDGVAFTAKDHARANIRELLSTKTQEFFGHSECSIRVNSVQSNLCHLDLEEILAKPLNPEFLMPSSIHLPKVDDTEILDEFAYMLNAAVSAWIKPSSPQKIGLIMFIESAKALIQLRNICEEAMKLKQKSVLVPECLVFGSDDFVADIGAVRTETNKELLYGLFYILRKGILKIISFVFRYARQKIVAHAKAFGMQAIDLVHIDYKDLKGICQIATLSVSKLVFKSIIIFFN